MPAIHECARSGRRKRAARLAVSRPQNAGGRCVLLGCCGCETKTEGESPSVVYLFGRRCRWDVPKNPFLQLANEQTWVRFELQSMCGSLILDNREILRLKRFHKLAGGGVDDNAILLCQHHQHGNMNEPRRHLQVTVQAQAFDEEASGCLAKSECVFPDEPLPLWIGSEQLGIIQRNGESPARRPDPGPGNPQPLAPG